MPADSYERKWSDVERTSLGKARQAVLQLQRDTEARLLEERLREARLGLGPSKRSGPLTFLIGCGWGAFCLQCLHWLEWLK